MDTNANNTLPQEATFEVEGFKRITELAPAMLEQNEASKAKAIDFANGLFNSIAQHGMSDATDELLKSFIGKAKTTIDAMNERRKPFTQLVDVVKKRFTILETELKQTMETAQKHRDGYATRKMQERMEEERKVQLKLNRNKELILLRQQAETQIAEWAEKVLVANKHAALKLFNGFTLETIKDAAEMLECVPNYPAEDTLCPSFDLRTTALINAEDIVSTSADVKSEFDWDGFIKRHGAEMEQLKKEMTDKIPSKRRELEELAKADAEEKAHMEEARLKREEAEQARIIAEAEAARKKAEEEAAIKATEQTTNAIVDSASVLFNEKPDVKTGYKITATAAAYLMLAQFYMEKEGKNLAIEKLERVTFDRMRRFCEDYALKNEEFIKSDLIKYEPIYKAK